MPLQHGNNQSQKQTTNSKSRIIDIKNQPSVQNSSINFRTSTNSSYFKKSTERKLGSWQLEFYIASSHEHRGRLRKKRKERKKGGKKTSITYVEYHPFFILRNQRFVFSSSFLFFLRWTNFSPVELQVGARSRKKVRRRQRGRLF